MSERLPPIVMELQGDDSHMARTLDRAKLQLRQFAADVEKIKPVVVVDAKLRDGALAEIRRRVSDGPPAKLKVDLQLSADQREAVQRSLADREVAVSVKLRDGALAEIRRRVSDGPAAKLKVDLQLSAGQREAVQRSLADREVAVSVKPKVDSTALRRVQTILTELGRPIRVSVRLGVDERTQRRAETQLARLSRDRTVTVRTRVIGAGSAAAGAANDAGALQALISLAPALVPIAASAVSVAASVGAATVAVGAFGLAVAPQIKQMAAAATAQNKYTDAVRQYGLHSQQAIRAQTGLTATFDALPPATRRAAMAFSDFKDDFKSWSNGLASFTMEPVERSFAVLEQMLPKFSPMAKSAAGDLNRLVTLAGGAVATPGFDALSQRFSDFADRTLKNATGDVVHFSRVLSEGGADGPIARFLRYAKQEGPQVRQALVDISKAAENVLQGASQAGPGMLTLVDAVARLVNALPPEFVGRVMQVYAAFRVYKLASVGVTAVSAALTTFTGAARRAGEAAAASSTGTQAFGNAFATLSTKAKFGLVTAALTAVTLTLHAFANSHDAPKIDQLSTALGRFGQNGAITGAMKAHLGDLSTSLAAVANTASDNKWLTAASNVAGFLGVGNQPSIGQSKKNFDSLDKALANLYQSGHATEAAAAYSRLQRAFIAGGGSVARFKDKMDDYNQVLADSAFEAKMTASSMGVFGDQAQVVQKKLDAQKRAAQGLQQAILDLNDANRQGLDAQSDYQQAISDATAGIKKHQHALTMSNGQLNLQSQAARDSYGLLSKLAAAAEASSVATLQQTGSQNKANRVLLDAHDRLVATAEKMGLNTQKATQLANALDNIKDPKIQVTANIMQAESALATAQKKVNNFPKSARTTANFAYSQAMSELQFYRRQLDRLDGRVVTVTINGKATGVNASTYYQAGPHKGAATGTIISSGVRRMAEGGFGRPAMMARGGTNVLWAEGPDESYIPHTRNARSRRIAEDTVGILGGAVSWRGAGSGIGASLAASTAPLGAQVARGLWAGMDGQAAWLSAQAARFATQTIPEPIADALGIHSPSRVAVTLGRWVGAGMVQGLTGSTASVKSATLRITRSIEQVFHDDAARQLAADKKELANLAGVKGKKAAHHRADLRSDIRQQQTYLHRDSAISRYVAADNARLLKLAAQRDTVSTKLKAAQSKLTALQKSWTGEKNQIASGILSGASVITASPQPGASLTAQDVLNNLRDQANKAQQFTAELQQLQKRGLRSDLLQELAAGGVDQAGATALALAGSSKGQLQAVNKMQATLSTAANGAGSAVANAMYGAGIKSAQGLVKGLASQHKAIDAEMVKIAKSMEKAIKAALGIHSPSRVMAVVGDNTALGMAVGVKRSSKHAVIAAQGMAMAVRQGATITGGGGYHGGGGGGDTYVTVHVQGSVVTERKLVDSIETALTVRARSNPGRGFMPANPWNGR